MKHDDVLLYKSFASALLFGVSNALRKLPNNATQRRIQIQ